MASKAEDDMSCFVCDEIYTDPVTLGCTHCFCRSCLQQFRQKNGSEECPVCLRCSSMVPPYMAVNKLSEDLSEWRVSEDIPKLQKLNSGGEATVKKKIIADHLHVLPKGPGESPLQQGTAKTRELSNAVNKREVARAKEIVDGFENVVLNIAVTGESGAGKSSFVNAIRGLSDTDEGAALVDEDECTIDPIPTAYPHPTMPNVNIWDLPGIGTSTFNASSYARKMNFKIYDLFIIVNASRFRENDIKLATEIQEKKKNFYFVRSKLDTDVASAERRGITEEETLKKIRNKCTENLIKLGHPAGSPVFLITSHDLSRFDLPKLVDTLAKHLPEHKRDALVMTLPVYSQQSLEKKYKISKKSVWAVAVLSGGIAAAPVPGLSTACDVAMVASFLTKCYHSFGLDDKSLIKLGNRVNKPILEKVKESKLIQALAKRTMLSPELLIKLGLAGALETVSIVPGVGSVIAAGVSFATTRSVLLSGLQELYDAGKTVIEMAELK